MKGLSQESNGRWRYQFTNQRARCRISLGAIPKHAAEAVCRHIQQILVARASGAILPVDTARWLGDAPQVLLNRLVKEGVLAPSMIRPAAGTLGEFMEMYFSRPDDRARRTLAQLKIAKKNLLSYFDPQRDLRSINAADAEDFKRWLKQPRGKKAKVWAAATVNRICGRSKEIFAYAVKKQLIETNPFAGVKGLTVQANPDRQFIVDSGLTQQVLDAMPDLEWRLIFSLARFGGLRCPSELVLLRWEDILWDVSKIKINCKKTQRYEGRQVRFIPLFTELHELLQQAWELAPEGAEWVITRYRKETANPGVQLHRILAKAGIQPWPKLFQNLRFTRANELAEEYPDHVVNYWLGHTTKVSQKHYRTTMDEHFRRATLPKAGAPAGDPRRVKNGSKRSHTEPHQGPRPDTRATPNPRQPAESIKRPPIARQADSQPNARERT